MKLVKSLLLGSAAGLAAVAGAQAADLPVQKAAPVEYVRVCSAYGVGFFYIPGTDTCLRVSGRARFEYNVASARQFSQSPTGFRSQGRLNLDARTQTAYGTLRAFVRFEISRRTGQFHSGTAIRQGNAEPRPASTSPARRSIRSSSTRRSSSSPASPPVGRRRSSTSMPTTSAGSASAAARTGPRRTSWPTRPRSAPAGRRPCRSKIRSSAVIRS